MASMICSLRARVASSLALTAGSLGVGGQHYDAQRRVLLKGGRPEGRANDLWLFCVRGYEHRHRLPVPGEVTIEFRARNTHVLAEGEHRALPGEQVHESGEREEGHDD